MHIMIVGQTGSGKSTFGIRLASRYKAKGLKNYVLDPLKEPRWREVAHFITDDPEEFYHEVMGTQNAMVHIDEAPKMLGNHAGELNEIATMGRHHGHLSHYYAQRAMKVDITTRMQCSTFVIFNQGRKDSRELFDDLDDPMVLDAPKLEKGEYIYKTRMQPAFRLHLFKNNDMSG